MKILKAIILGFFLGAILITSSCKKKNGKEENTDIDKPADYPGFNFSKERPPGVLYQYPAGVSVVGSVLKSEIECVEEGGRQKKFYGIGGQVALCVTFYNDNNTPVNLVFPPGTIWICTTGDAQNGILPTRVSIELPPKQHYFAIINASCVNTERTGSNLHTYETTPVVTQHPGMLEFFKLLENKKANYEDYGGIASQAGPFQVPITRAVTAISENRAINNEIMAAINALPNR